MKRSSRCGARCWPARRCCIHAAGWLEGGLSVSFEKLITDIEALQTIAELCAATPGDDDAIGFEAIAEVQPGGHFFSAGHTMARYRTAFYEPLVADWSNFGNWSEAGGKNATLRANAIWKKRLAEFQAPDRRRGGGGAARSLHRPAQGQRRRPAGLVTGRTAQSGTRTMQLTLEQIYQLSLAALRGSGASQGQAAPVADSIREAEAEGIRNVGLGYLPIYCEHLRCGKVKGDAVPRLIEAAPAVLRVDAGHGFCHPAFLLALPRFAEMAEASGVAVLAIARSYSAGVVGWFVERLADRGLVALAFANSSASIAPWGGSKALFGTNPIGFAAPRPNGPPIVVDMASSATARVNIVQAAARGEEVPPGWVFDSEGKPTTDPKALACRRQRRSARRAQGLRPCPDGGYPCRRPHGRELVP